MLLSELDNYIKGKEELIKGECKFEMGDNGEFYVTFTKEVYNFYDEVSADSKVNEVKDDHGFKGVDKSFKEGKTKRDGTEIPDIYTVTAKLNH